MAVRGPEHVDTMQAMLNVAQLFEDEENWEGAKQLYNRILSIRRKHTEPSGSGPEVADLLVSLSHIFEVQGDLPKALALYEEAKDVYIQFFGRSHLTVAACLSGIADIYDQQGLLADALQTHRKALDMRRRLYLDASEYMGLDTNDPKNPPWTVIGDSLNSVGELLWDIGEQAAARDSFEEALRIREIHYNLSGKSEVCSIALAATRSNLAEALLPLGPAYWDRAKSLLDMAYSTRFRLFGNSGHPTQQTLNLQAIVYELIQMEKMRQDTIAARRQKAAAAAAVAAAAAPTPVQLPATPSMPGKSVSFVPPPSGAAAVLPGTPVTTAALESALTAGPTVESAISSSASDSKAYVAAGGDCSTSAIASNPGLAAIAEEDETMPVKGVADTTAGQQLDPDLKAAHDLLTNAIDKRDEGEYEKALDAAKAAMDRLQPTSSTSGERRLALSVACSYCGSIFEDARDYPRAEIAYRMSLDKAVQTYGADYVHTDVARALSNLGGVLRLQAKHEEAYGFLERAYGMWRTLEDRQPSDDHQIELARLHHSIGLCHLGMGQLDAALERMTLATERRLELFGDGHPDYFASLNSLGLIKAARGDLEGALSMLTQALALREAAYGTADPAYALAQSSAASIFFRFDDLSRAGRLFTECFDPRERQVGRASPDVLTALQNLAAVFLRQEDPLNATPFSAGAATIRQYFDEIMPPPPLQNDTLF